MSCRNMMPKAYYDPNQANGCNNAPLISPGPPRFVITWRLDYLVSNRQNAASHQDLLLINPWGIVFYNNQLWVVNDGSDTITNYDPFGNRILAPISLRSAFQNASQQTAIVVNCGGGFTVSSNSIGRSSQFLISGEHGTVQAYSPFVDPTQAYMVLNMQLTGEVSVFKGMALANDTMYLCDFFQRHIDVFDANYNRLLGFPFVDNDPMDPIPLTYAPYNIVHIGCYLYVLYAEKDPNLPMTTLDGPGHGFISVFNLDGSFVRRFTSRGVLNSPWAMIPAPCACGIPPGSFLVGNNGDGRINIFDCDGLFVGPLLGQAGLPVVIDGLRGLAAHYTNEFSRIYYTASPDQNIDGMLGVLTAGQTISF